MSGGQPNVVRHIHVRSCEATNRNRIRGRWLGSSTPTSAKTNRKITSRGRCGACAGESSRTLGIEQIPVRHQQANRNPYPGRSNERTRTIDSSAVGASAGNRKRVRWKSAEAIVPQRHTPLTTGRAEHLCVRVLHEPKRGGAIRVLETSDIIAT